MQANQAFVSLPSAAHQLRMSLRRAIAMIHAGQLRARFVEGRWSIRQDSVDAFLRKHWRVPCTAQGSPPAHVA